MKLTMDGAVVGTPSHMPPEQATGKAVTATPAGDRYSLGVLLYELLTGRPPFAGTPELILFLHHKQEPLSPRSHRPDLPLELEAICLRCLRKDPARRYAGWSPDPRTHGTQRRLVESL